MKKNVFSRTLAVLASTAVLGAASMISASAAGEAISLSDVVGQPGETVTMPIVVSANNDCNSFDLLVAWDDATLTGSAATFSGCNGDTVLGDQMVSVVGYTSSTMADGAVVTISSLNSFSTSTDGDVAVDSVSVSGGTITVEIPEATTEAPTEEATTEAPTAAPTEEATTAAATTAAPKKTTGSPKTGVTGVAVAVAGLVTAGATAVVLKKRH